MDSQVADLPPHVLMFPLPVQGHVNTMLRLAELLCLAGLDVTFILSDFNHARLMKHSNDAVSRFAGYPGFRFQTISDGLPDDHPRSGEAFGDLLPAMKNITAPLFKKMMTENRCFASATRRPVSCIIADGFGMSFAVNFVEENGIDIILFRTVTACSFWAALCIPQLIEAQELPIKGEDMDGVVKNLPGMEGILRKRDLPHFFRVNDVNDASFQTMVREMQLMQRAKAVIMNTFEDLEGSVLSEIRKHIPRLFTIGPNHYLLKTQLAANYADASGASASFWKEDRSCLAWLDSQPPKSVIYVSFGSLATLTREQLLEFWHGLLNSRTKFLWVMRPDSVKGKDGHVGIPFDDATYPRGFYAVSWAPQQEVLNHSAIGGFLTHGGWNSILESIVAGVPMICWPYLGDQTINSRFVSEVWKNGLDMKDTCDRVTIARMVMDLMDVRKDEFLQRAHEMAILAKKAVNKGGSSYHNLASLVDFIKSSVCDDR